MLRRIEQLPAHVTATADTEIIELRHDHSAHLWLACEGAPELLFTENETNYQRLYGSENPSPYVKDGINDYVVQGVDSAVNPEAVGTKAAALYRKMVQPGETVSVRLRLFDAKTRGNLFGTGFDRMFAKRREEAEIRKCLGRLEQLSGKKVRGWFGAGGGESMHTPDILKRCGVEFTVHCLH